MGDVVAIIPARAGSKGIPGKNLTPLCGRPLVEWSIRQALSAACIQSVWVTSDGEAILDCAARCGARPIVRPPELAGDRASSESAWLHALDVITATNTDVEWIVGIQATSPIRESSDFDRAMAIVTNEGLDSLFTATEVQDHFMWAMTPEGPVPVGRDDYRTRPPRQLIEKRYLENGSFYIFRPSVLRTHECRLGGRIGMYVMEFHKSFQIDAPADLDLCAAVMKGYGLC